MNNMLNAQKLQKFYAGKNILVTGGCGFIGSHVAEKLTHLGARVTILDDLSTGSLKNIQDVKNKVTFWQGDVTDFDTCAIATKNKDIIFHLAAFISVPHSFIDPTLCHKVNVDGTFNILQAARQNNVSRVIFSSSAAVYGPHEGVCSEKTACNPTSPYGFSKLIGEYYCMQYRTNFNLSTVALRYFNVWGARQNSDGPYSSAVAQFSQKMKQNKPITIFGDGKQTRDFVSVGDVADANILLGMHAPQLKESVFNIASGKSITILNLIDELKKQFPDYTGSIQFAPARSGDVFSSQADCSRYYQLFG